MAKNTMDDLRDHLFETIEALKDDDKPMDLARAKTICEVADRLIDTAKVEVNLMNISGSLASKFLPAGDDSEKNKPLQRPALVAGR